MMAKALANFSAWSGLKNLAQIRRMVPVKYVDEPDVAPTDVAICSSTGNWATYRNWPYFPELKSLLTAHGIRWVDISELRDNRCLNQVKKSRLYLGLDTGVSHLVSSVVNSGLIIQSGFSNIHYWSSYGYQTIEHDVYCRNCFLRQGCPNEHRCMRDILPAEVLARIKKLLGLT
jgi:ADP-heptose:LPS heptosyltransferase